MSTLFALEIWSIDVFMMLNKVPIPPISFAPPKPTITKQKTWIFEYRTAVIRNMKILATWKCCVKYFVKKTHIQYILRCVEGKMTIKR